ncbi:MAG: hypothetical protein IPF53_09725 [Blastocatellia bacterium]|nr:hypothetical protein [Blastocatellia bacterium]
MFSRQLLGGLVTFALVCAHVAVVRPEAVSASGTPVSLTSTGVAVTENFNTLASSGTSSTVPAGWAFSEAGTNANMTYDSGTGSGTAGNTYSFGAAANAERAFGGLLSGSLTPTIGACFQNNTGSTLTSLDIAYTGEQWRLGALARVDRIDFEYSLDATSLTTGTWVGVDALDFTAPTTTGTTGALDGNAAANRTAVSASITSLSIPSGAIFFIRWTDLNAAGSDDGLSVDDFSLTPQGGPPVPALTVSVAPSSVSEAAGANAATGTVTRVNDPGGNASPLSVMLSSGDTTEATVPAMVMIPATMSSTTFAVDAVDDMAVDGTQVATITATAGGFTNGTFNVSVTDNDVSLTLISVVQGDVTVLASPANVSTLVGMSVTLQGVVTNTTTNGFWLQEEIADDDGNANTSEGIFVFTSTAPTVVRGQIVRVAGMVAEFTPGGAGSGNLSITQITGPAITPIGMIPDTGTPGIDVADLRAAVNIRLLNNLPSTLIYNGANPNDPSSGIEFWETIEGMLAEVTSGTVVSPTNAFGEFTVVAPGNATLGSGYFPASHNLIIQGADPAYVDPAFPPTIGGGDFNPERIVVDDRGGQTPSPVVAADGDVVANIVGTVDYSFGVYKLQPVVTLTNVTQNSQADPLAPQGGDLRVVTFNLENIFDTVNEPGRADSPILTQPELDTKVAKLSQALMGPLALPDILVCPEAENPAVVQLIADAVNTATGTTNYQVRSLDAADDRSIEVAFIYNANRVTLQSTFTPGLLLTPPGNPGSGTTVGDDAHVRSASVGPFADVNLGTAFIADTSDVFEGGPGAMFSDSREPLVGVFRFNGRDILVMGVHLASKGGDGPLFGVTQPVVRGSEPQRIQQALYVRQLVDLFLTGDAPRAIPAFDRVIVTGDYNDFQFPETGEVGMDAVTTIQGLGVMPSRFLTDLLNDVAAAERYSFIFDGNSQALDHMLVSPVLLAERVAQDVCHINADYPPALSSDTMTFNRSSDHDPLAATFQIVAPNQTPIANAGMDQSINACTVVSLNGSGSSDPDSGPAPLTFQWTQTAGPTVVINGPTTATPTFEAPNVATSEMLTFQLTVSDSLAMNSASVNVTVNHVSGMNVDTVGLYTTGGNTFFLRNCNAPGPADVTTFFGANGWTPLRGDWDGNGTETVGAYDPTSGCFFLRNSNTPGGADVVVCFGAPGSTPVVGDWDGNGTVTVGTYIPASGTFFLKNTNAPGPADVTVNFGPANAVPILGDWDGNGSTTLGVHIESTGAFFLKNTNAAGAADIVFTFGPGTGFQAIVGDWDGVGGVSIGLFAPATGAFFLKNTNAGGGADMAFMFGVGGGVTPMAGNWDGF